MTAPIQQCMGGWCHLREACAHYLAPPLLGHKPAERLCQSLPEPEPVRVSMRLQPYNARPVEA